MGDLPTMSLLTQIALTSALAIGACAPGQPDNRAEPNGTPAGGALPTPAASLDAAHAGPSVVAVLGTVTSDDGRPVPGARILLVANGRTPGPQMPSAGICDGGERAWNEAVTDSAGNYWAFLRSERGGPVCYAVVVDPPTGYGRRTVMGGVAGVMTASEQPQEVRIDVKVLQAD